MADNNSVHVCPCCGNKIETCPDPNQQIRNGFFTLAQVNFWMKACVTGNVDLVGGIFNLAGPKQFLILQFLSIADLLERSQKLQEWRKLAEKVFQDIYRRPMTIDFIVVSDEDFAKIKAKHPELQIQQFKILCLVASVAEIQTLQALQLILEKMGKKELETYDWLTQKLAYYGLVRSNLPVSAIPNYN